MHQLQKILLKRLSVQNNQRYASLTSGYDFEDNVLFHLKSLIKNEYIEKHEGIYSITLAGVKEIAQYEPIQLKDKGVKTFFIGFLCSDSDGNYLIKSHPNAQTNFYNLPSGKPYFGEPIKEALPRLFKLNSGIDLPSNHFEFCSLHLKTIQTKDAEVIFDDAFAIYTIHVTDVQKKEMKLLDSVSWKSVEEISDLINRWPELDICILNKDLDPYKVYTYESGYIL